MPGARAHETEADIYRAIETKIHEGRVKGQDNKFAIVGFNTKGNPIEVNSYRFSKLRIAVYHLGEKGANQTYSPASPDSLSNTVFPSSDAAVLMPARYFARARFSRSSSVKL